VFPFFKGKDPKWNKKLIRVVDSNIDNLLEEKDEEKLYDIRNSMMYALDIVDTKLFDKSLADNQIMAEINKWYQKSPSAEKQGEHAVIQIYKSGFYTSYIGYKAAGILNKYRKDIDLLIGIPKGAIPFTISTFLHTNIPIGLVYPEKGEICPYGVHEEGWENAVLLDEFIKTGETMLNSSRILSKGVKFPNNGKIKKYEIDMALVILEEGNEAKDKLKEEGVKLKSIFRV